MEFFMSTSDAQNAIRLMSVTARMNVISYEGQVLIKVKEDEVVFISNNGKSGVRCTYPAKVISQGECSVVFSKIKSFIMTFSPWDGEVGSKEFRFRTSSNKLLIDIESTYEHSSSKNNLSLNLMKVSSFMDQFEMDEPNLILNSSIVSSAISKTLYAIDNKSGIDFASGLRMLFTDEYIIFTATNGKVVSEYSVPNDSSLKEGEYFLSYDFLAGIKRIIVENTQLFFKILKNKINLTFNNVCFWANSLSYRDYPNYYTVFDNYNRTFEIRRDIILNALASVSDILDPEDFNRVMLEVSNNVLLLKTDSSLFEYPELDIAEDVSTDVDGKDLIKILQSMSDDYIKFKGTDEHSGLIVESLGHEKQRAYIVNLTKR